eukprot:scaffold59549_cov21-Tisochrysis_lutea.AAC.1
MIHAPPSFQCPTCTAPPALALLQGPTHAVPPVCTTPIAVPTHAVHPPLAGYQCKKHGVQTPTARSMGSSTVCSAGLRMRLQRARIRSSMSGCIMWLQHESLEPFHTELLLLKEGESCAWLPPHPHPLGRNAGCCFQSGCIRLWLNV